MPRYVIYGAGAIGGILGGYLYRAGKEVVLIGRGPHADEIRHNGLQLVANGLTHRIKVGAVDSLAKIKVRSDDRVVLTVKTQHTASATETLGRVYPPGTPVVSLQNAIRNEEILRGRFENVYAALVEFSGNFLKPGMVELTRNNLIAIGCFPRGYDSLAESIACDLASAGFQVERRENIMQLKWWKLIINTNNALLAILGYWLQKGQSDPEVYPLMADVMEESLQVVRAAGIEPQPPQQVPPLEVSIQKLRSGEMVCAYDLGLEERTYTSTWQDLQLKRGCTEVDFLNGEIERLGSQNGIPTPRNSFLLRTVREMASKGELPGKYSAQELKSVLENR